MSKLIKCKSCNDEIATWAKNCPSCGAKNKKPFYKRGWFIAIAIFVIIGAIGSAGNDDTTTTDNGTTGTEQEVSQEQNTEKDVPVEKVEEDVPTEYKSALKQAKIYSKTMHMSKAGIYDQLTSEYGGQFTEEACSICYR